VVVPVGLSYRSPTTSIHALCIQQEAFTTSHPLLISEKAKKLYQTLFLESRSYTSMLKFPLFPNEQLSLRHGHTGHSVK
jgi:hypothetical protein